MAQSGVSVAPECLNDFNELKLGKNIKWIIYKIADNGKEIVVEDKSSEDKWDAFREKLISAKSGAGAGPRYAVYDITFDVEGAGKRSKITFIAWSPDTASIKPKMLYSSSKEALKRSLNGIAVEIQANDEDDIEWDTITSNLKKSAR